MIGAELVYKDNTPAIAEADIIMEKMKDQGFLIGKNGPNRNVLAFQPPLVITANDLNNMLNHLDDILGSLTI